MIRLMAIKLLIAPLTVLAVSTLVFAIVNLLPGDPVLAFLGDQATPEVVNAQRERLGLNEPVVQRYFEYIGNAVRGDFGSSPITGQAVSDAIGERAAASAELLILAMLLAVIVGIILGVIAAAYRNGPIDIAISSLAIGGVAMPSFYLGVLLILLFTIQLGWLPPSGYIPFADNPGDNLKHMILPSVTLSLSIMPVIMRQTRASMVEVLRQDYIRTARSKGLQEANILRTHALGNSLLPVVTVIGLTASRLFGGAVIVESVFAIPGIGRLSVDAVVRRDLVTLQGIVALVAVVVVFVNIATDLVYGLVDPRIRTGSSG